MIVKGKNSSLSIDERSITITRKAPFQRASIKTIPIANITAIMFQPASFGSAFGYMIFSIYGGQEPRRGSTAASMNDNAVLFKHRQEKDFLQAKEHIEKIIESL